MNYSSYLLLLISVFTFTSAYGANDRSAISGAGAISCGKWIETREMKNDDINMMLSSWLQGFLSGMNTQRYVTTKKEMALIPDSATLLAYVDKACKDSPLDSVYLISMRLYQDIHK